MKYRGLTGTTNYNENNDVFYGKIAEIDDLVLYESDTKEGLEESFREAVDDYMETLKELRGGMEEGYYLPEIEEFHYGLEYEMVPSTGMLISNIEGGFKKIETIWSDQYKKGIFGEKGVNIYGDGFPEIKEAIKNKKVRVKKLDKEDIESLGFNYNTISDPDQLIFFRGNICLYFRPNTQEVSTFTLDPSKNDFMREYTMDNYRINTIVIKNKFELKRLMKQMGIIQ